MNRTLFFTMSSWYQLFFICFIAFFGLMLTALIAQTIMTSNPAFVLSNSGINFLWVIQTTQASLVFMLPACFCAYLFHAKPFSYLKIKNKPKVEFIVISVALIILVQPIINLTNYYNHQLVLPDFMADIEAWMIASENNTKLLVEKLLLSDNSISSLLINLFVVAVLAGLVEEFFFRGSIQQLFNKITENHHLAIWISAIIFSAIHLQFYGFVPRMLLGALLGYLFVWSGNLWVPVIVHFVNNALSVLLFRTYHQSPTYNTIENIGVGETWWIALASLILSFVILYHLSRHYVRAKIMNF